MRILFVTPYVPSRIRVRPFMFLRELTRLHEVSVLTLWSSAREREDLVELRRLYPTVGVRLSRAQALANCLRAVPTSVPLQGAYGRSPEIIRLLAAAVADGSSSDVDLPPELRGPFDVVHVEHLRAAYLGEVLPNATPAVIDAVDCISLLLERTRRYSYSRKQRLLSAFELPRMRRYEGRALERFDRVVTTSPVDADALRALKPGLDVKVITNGVDLSDPDAPDVCREPDSIVFAGKMSYHANATAACFFARRVFPQIRAARPNASFHIVGSDPPPEVRALASEPGVVVTGYVPDVSWHVRRATVAVAPMLVKVGVQNKVLEAMAAGTPVVATPAGAEGLEAKAGQHLLVAANAADFAQQAIRVLGQPGLRDSLAIAGRRYVEQHHCWDASTRQLEGIYAASIADKRPRPESVGEAQ